MLFRGYGYRWAVACATTVAMLTFTVSAIIMFTESPDGDCVVGRVCAIAAAATLLGVACAPVRQHRRLQDDTQNPQSV